MIKRPLFLYLISFISYFLYFYFLYTFSNLYKTKKDVLIKFTIYFQYAHHFPVHRVEFYFQQLWNILFYTSARLCHEKQCKYCLPIHPRFKDDSSIPSLLRVPKEKNHKVLNLVILEAISKGYLDIQSSN